MRYIYKSLFFIVFSSSLFSQNEDCCCPASDPCAKCAQIWPERGPRWMVTPNAGPCVACGFDTNITVELIYWTAREEHLAFAYRQSIESTPSGTTVTSQKHVADPDWNYRPGFKVGVGYLYDHDGWDIYANYTWYTVRNTDKKLTIDDLATENINTIWPFSSPLTMISEIQGAWELDFNTIDLELGRNFFISCYLKLRPHFGLKGTWQDQKYDVRAIGTLNGISAHSLDMHRLDYWGIGIRAGLDSAWQFNRSTSLIGEIAATGLWEHFEPEEKSSVTPLAPGAFSDLRVINVENDFRTIKPVLELYIALRWETWFCCDCYHFSIEAGWETQWWANQNQFFDASSESRLGDLSLQGATIKARIDF